LIATTVAVGMLVFGGLVGIAGGGRVLGWAFLLFFVPFASERLRSGEERCSTPARRGALSGGA
jgi:hypothetical protein